MSINLISKMLLGAVALMATTFVCAQTVSEKGMGSVTYSGWHLSPKDRQAAIQKAEFNAIERYIAATDAARSRIFEQQHLRMAAHAGDYILGSTVLNEEDDKPTKSFNVVIRADINAPRLLNDLGSGSASASDVAEHNHLQLTFLFVARSQSTVQTFDDKVYRRADAEASTSKKTQEGESIHAHAVGTSEHVDGHSSLATTTGGSTTRKAAKVEWTLAPAGDVNTAMTGIFSDAGYQPIDAAMVEADSNGLLNIKAIRDAYSHGNDLPGKMLFNATKAIHQAEIPLFALGTLDIGLPDIDPVSGNTRVYVTVTGKVYDVRSRFASTVVAVGPVQFAGMGPNKDVARNNALALASRKAAQTMVDELNNKGIH